MSKAMMKNIIPFSAPKNSLTSVVTPQAYLSRTLNIPIEKLSTVAPSSVIICLENELYGNVKGFGEEPEYPSLPGNLKLIPGTNGAVGVCGGVGVGAPVLALLVEDLIALGVKQFIGLGTAGLLKSERDEEDQKRLFVCVQAVRDEGTSRHYLDVDQPACASPSLTSRFCKTLERKKLKFEESVSWTTDAPYRETLEELVYYRELGVKTVEMEASALFSVATYKGVDFALSFAISDVFEGASWVPYYGSHTLQNQLLHLFIAAADTFGAKLKVDPHNHLTHG